MNSLMEAKQASLSILMFPWLAHGHVFPYLELARHLCKHNLSIFFCSTPINLKSVHESLETTSERLLPISRSCRRNSTPPSMRRRTSSRSTSRPSTPPNPPSPPSIYLRPHEWRLRQASVSNLKKEGASMAHFTRSCHVLLMKTSRPIQGKYIDYLSMLSNKTIVPTGPRITTTTTPDSDSDSDIMDWLSKKERFSTIFISLGSENYLSKNQVQEMAKGLEASNVNFIWAWREKGRAPIGVCREREKIVEGWPPQAQILGHDSICGFISHCGMNSTIESVYFGVPVIGIPIKLDQPLNSRLLVEAGVCVEVVRDENGDSGGDDVAAAIKRVVGRR